MFKKTRFEQKRQSYDPKILLEELTALFREEATERVSKELFLRAGPTLVKISIEAARRERYGFYTSFFCKILEINGVPVDEHGHAHGSEAEEQPSAEEQRHIIAEALEAHGVAAEHVAVVSESYAQEYRRVVLTLQARLARDRKYAAPSPR